MRQVEKCLGLSPELIVQQSNMIKNFDKAKHALGDFQFSEFRIVREFRFYETASKSIYNVDMALESESRKQNYKLTLTFHQVSGLKIDNFGGGETRIIGFDIKDMSKNQWEGISWKISDYENNMIEFYAKMVEVISIDPT